MSRSHDDFVFFSQHKYMGKKVAGFNIVEGAQNCCYMPFLGGQFRDAEMT